MAFILLCFMSISVFSQTYEAWRYKHFIDGTHEMKELMLDADGNCIAVNTANEANDSLYNFYHVMKVDTGGTLHWEFKFAPVEQLPTINNHFVVSAHIDNEQNIYVAGNGSKTDMVKISPIGDTIWHRELLGGNARNSSIIATLQNNTYIQTQNNSVQTQYATVTIHKINEEGDTILYGEGSRLSSGADFMKADSLNNHLFLAGVVMEGTGVNFVRNLYLSIIDTHLTVLWDTVIDKGAGFMYYTPVRMLIHDDLLLCLTSRHNGNNQIELIVFDTQGNYLWETVDTPQLPGYHVDLQIDKDGNIWYGAVKGYNQNTMRFNSFYKYDRYGNLLNNIEIHGDSIKTYDLALDGNGNIYLLVEEKQILSIRKYSGNGNFIWQHQIDSIKLSRHYYFPNNMFNTNPLTKPHKQLQIDASGNIYLMGNLTYIIPGTHQTSEIILVKISQEPSNNSEDNATLSQVILYPNPSGNIIQLQSREKMRSYTITDLSGKVLEQKKRIKNPESIMLNVSDYPQGMYLCEVVFENSEREVKKFVVGR